MMSRLPSSQLIASEELSTGEGQKDQKDNVCLKSHTDNRGELEAMRRGKIHKGRLLPTWCCAKCDAAGCSTCQAAWNRLSSVHK